MEIKIFNNKHGYYWMLFYDDLIIFDELDLCKRIDMDYNQYVDDAFEYGGYKIDDNLVYFKSKESVNNFIDKKLYQYIVMLKLMG